MTRLYETICETRPAAEPTERAVPDARQQPRLERYVGRIAIGKITGGTSTSRLIVCIHKEWQTRTRP